MRHPRYAPIPGDQVRRWSRPRRPSRSWRTPWPPAPPPGCSPAASRAEWYRNRWVRSRRVAAGLDEKWPEGPVFDNFDFAPNTNVLGHGGHTFALMVGGCRPYELSRDLDTLGPCDFGGTLKGGPPGRSHGRPSTTARRSSPASTSA